VWVIFGCTEKQTYERFSLVVDKNKSAVSRETIAALFGMRRLPVAAIFCGVNSQQWEVKGSGLSSTWHAQLLIECATCTEWTYIAYTVLDMFTLAWLLICHGSFICWSKTRPHLRNLSTYKVWEYLRTLPLFTQNSLYADGVRWLPARMENSRQSLYVWTCPRAILLPSVCH